MTVTGWALLGYAGWTLLLATGIVLLRMVLVLRGLRRANAFLPSGDDVSPFSGRLCRAHANCVENLPIAGVIGGLAIMADLTDWTDPTAPLLLGARAVQSSIHLVSTSSMAVQARFGAFVVQVAVLWWWCVCLVSAAV